LRTITRATQAGLFLGLVLQWVVAAKEGKGQNPRGLNWSLSSYSSKTKSMEVLNTGRLFSAFLKKKKKLCTTYFIANIAMQCARAYCVYSRLAIPVNFLADELSARGARSGNGGKNRGSVKSRSPFRQQFNWVSNVIY
jgi:hypothetical protein